MRSSLLQACLQFGDPIEFIHRYIVPINGQKGKVVDTTIESHSCLSSSMRVAALNQGLGAFRDAATVADDQEPNRRPPNAAWFWVLVRYLLNSYLYQTKSFREVICVVGCLAI